MARVIAALTVFIFLFVGILTLGVDAQQAPPTCRISGRIVSGTTPLPGVSVIVRAAGGTAAVTSTDLDGRYELTAPTGTFTLAAELTGFSPIERPLETTTTCAPQTIDLQLAVAPRTTTPAGARQGAGRGRFETLTVARQEAAQAAPVGETETNPLAQLALPPGFSTDGPSDTVAVNGNAASVDRGALGDRLDAIGRGDFGPGDGGPPGGFGGFGAPPPGGPQGGPRGGGGPGVGGGGPGGPPGGGPGGARGGGRGGFAGRGGRQGAQGQRVYTFQSGYTLGGSMLDAVPYQLRPTSTPNNPTYLRQNADVTLGGPLWIPGIYDGTRRTTFNLNYQSNRGQTLFDQYATVPTAAMRAGDFSTSSRTLVDPATGEPFASNQIPGNRLDPGAVYLLSFLPLPNLDSPARNFRYITTTNSSTDNLNVRLNHNLTPNAQGGRFGGGGGGAGGRGGGAAGAAGARGRGAQAGLTAALNAQVQFRRNDDERNNVFPTLGGRNTGSSLTLPVGLNVTRRRVLHAFNVNVSRTRSATANQYAFATNVAALAGISGVSTDPFDWGVPSLSFSSLSSLNDLTPSERTDTRLSASYSWSRPTGRHNLRAGGDIRRDIAASRTNTNSRGAFVFTGLYSGNDFADFLLGAPQQASVNFNPGRVALHGRSMSLFVQDDWRRSGRLTFNLGLRYELTWPLTEANGQLVNLDVSPAFTAATPVVAGGTGLFSGTFPSALIRTDFSNLAPRVGVAWRASQRMVVRGGYGVSYNAGTYSQIARQLASQPPFAETETSIGTTAVPLQLENAFAAVAAATTTNNFGVDPDYQLGRVQTWNVDVNRDLSATWTLGGGYSFAAGSNLDLVRAPNRGPSGLRIDGVQPFLWQTSESSSRLHSAVFRLRRRPAKGIGGGLTYTLAQSRDNASSIGGGTVVAQDDQNLNAEWGLSSFNRRNVVQGNLNIDLPWGPNRKWLTDAGIWTTLLKMWTVNLTVNLQAGTPLTARVLSSSADAARGTNGTLRANYNGDVIGLGDPTINQYFNTAAFSIPSSGAFGTAGRNMITGPGSKDVGAQFVRDVELGGTRVVTVLLRVNNLINLVNYAAVDTVVNSPSFGQVTSVRPMRSAQINLRFQF